MDALVTASGRRSSKRFILRDVNFASTARPLDHDDKTATVRTLSVVALVLTYAAHALAAPQWVSPVGYSGALDVAAFETTADGKSYVLQTTKTVGSPDTSYRLARLSANGAEEWAYWLPASGRGDLSSHLRAQTDNGVVVVYRGNCVAAFSNAGLPSKLECATSEFTNTNSANFGVPVDSDDVIAGSIGTYLRRVSKSESRQWTSSPLDSNSQDPTLSIGLNERGEIVERSRDRLRSWRADSGAAILNLPQTCATSCSYYTYRTKFDNTLAGIPDGSSVVFGSWRADENGLRPTVERVSQNGERLWSKSFNATANETAARMKLLPLSSVSATTDILLFNGANEFSRLRPDGSAVWSRSVGNDALRDVFLINGQLLVSSVRGIETFRSRVALSTLSPSTGDVVEHVALEVAAQESAVRFLPATFGTLITWPGGARFVNSAGSTLWEQVGGFRTLDSAIGVASANNGWSSAIGNVLVSDPLRGSWINGGVWHAFDPVTGAVTMTALNQPTSSPGFGAVVGGGQIQLWDITSTGIVLRRLSADGAEIWRRTINLGPNPAPLLRIESFITRAQDGLYFFTHGGAIGSIDMDGNVVFARYLGLPGASGYGLSKPAHLAAHADSTITMVVIDSLLPFSLTFVTRFSTNGTVLETTQFNHQGCAAIHHPPSANVPLYECYAGMTVRSSTGIAVELENRSTPAELSYLVRDSLGRYFGILTRPFGNNFSRTLEYVSWDSTGAQRWSFVDPAIEYCDAVCTRAGDRVIPDESGGAYVLVPLADRDTSNVHVMQLDSLGRETGRRFINVASDAIFSSRWSRYDDGSFVLFATRGGSDGARSVRTELRRFTLPAMAGDRRLRITFGATVSLRAGAPFSSTVHLVDLNGSTVVATNPEPVRVGVAAEGVALVGNRTCTIGVGQSSCTLTGLKADRVSGFDQGYTGIRLWAIGEGLPYARSEPRELQRVTVSVVIRPRTAIPIQAYTWQPVEIEASGATVDSLPPIATIESAAGGTTLSPCTTYEPSTNATRLTCHWFARNLSLPLTARALTPPGSLYDSSAGVSARPTVTPITPTISYLPDPTNSHALGLPIRYLVTLTAPSGVNVSPYVSTGSLTLNGAACAAPTVQADVHLGFFGSMVQCSFTPTTLGNQQLTLRFFGADDLLPTADQLIPVTVSRSATLTGSGEFPVGTEICSLDTRVSCQWTNANTWRCSGAEGLSSAIYFVPPATVRGYFPSTPRRFAGTGGNAVDSTPLSFRYSAGTCSLDLDGDGSITALTDSLYLLGRAPVAPNRCASRTAAQAAQHATFVNAIGPIDVWDLTLSRQYVRFNALVVTRYLFGFRGDALFNGIPSEYAVAHPPAAVESYLSNQCGYP
ncbi:MAG: hypothetical protein EAZ43_03260 [Betaproteobacteria bacterium]|nr:MAG: hypothetical protein EAZ43_03260 [Betaproteobacteria bacterium]